MTSDFENEDLLTLFERCRDFERRELGWSRVSDEAPAGPSPGLRNLGDFRIVREIGRGGMGIVFLAEQVSLHRQVALKVLSPASMPSSRERERFLREAQAAARLRHPNIVPVYSCSASGDFTHYTMEYVDGLPLDRLIEALSGGGIDGPRRADLELLGVPAGGRPDSAAGELYCQRVATLFSEVAEALQHAHGQGIVHRDIKPGNLILDAGHRLVLTDFGLALFHEQSRLTGTGAFLGTPMYMSPEQARGDRAIDRRSDIYSLGMTLYECLAARPPWNPVQPEKLLRGILLDDPPPLRRRNCHVPPELEAIVSKCIEKERAHRYQTAAELAGDLRAYVEGRDLSIRPTGRLTRWVRWARRRPYAAAAAALLAVTIAGAVAAAAFSWSLSRERNRLLYDELNRQGMDILLSSGTGIETRTLQDAFALFDRATALDPGRPEAWFHIALSHHQTAMTTSLYDYEPSGVSVVAAAERALDRALDADPSYSPAVLLKAQQLERKGDADEADRLRGRLPTVDHVPALGHWIEAERQFSDRQWERAAESYRASLRGRDAPFEGFRYHGHLQAGTCLLALHEFDDVIVHLRIAQELSPARIVPGILLGKAWFYRGDVERAEEEFELAVERAENKAEALGALAWTWYYMGERARAWRANERGLEQSPDYLRLRTNLSVGLWKLGSTGEAIVELRALDLEYPANGLVRWLLQVMLREQGLFDEAAQVVGAVPPAEHFRHPAHFQTRTVRAVQLLRSPGHEEEATQLCLRRLEDWERKPRSEVQQIGALLVQTLGPEGAIAAVQEILAAGRGRGAAAVLCGIHRQLGHREALTLLEVTETEPRRQFEILSFLGGEHLAARDYAGARVHFSRALEIRPDAARERARRARALEKLGEPVAALEEFRRAFTTDPFAGGRLTYRRLAVDLHREVDFLETWTSVLPRLSDWLYLGRLLARRLAPADRIRYWERALERHPGNRWVLLNLGVALAEDGRVPEAIRRLEESLERRSTGRGARKLSALVRASRPASGAADYFERRLRRRPDDFRARWSLGEARLDAADLERALESFSSAVELDPDESRWYRLLRVLGPVLPSSRLLALFEDARKRFPESPALEFLVATAGRLEARPLRINAGGKAHHDGQGRHWEGDRYFLGGLPARQIMPHVEGGIDSRLFESERRTLPEDADPLYAIPVPNGSWKVSIHIRVLPEDHRLPFVVRVEGEPLRWPEIGDRETVTLERDVDVRDGFVDIHAVGLITDGRLTALELLPSTSSGAAGAPLSPDGDHLETCPGALRLEGDRRRQAGDAEAAIAAYRKAYRLDPGEFPDYWYRSYGALVGAGASPGRVQAFLDAEEQAFGERPELAWLRELAGAGENGPVAVRINAGGGDFHDRAGRHWHSDRLFTGGLAASTPFAIEGTDDDAIYQVVRRGQYHTGKVGYAIPVAPGSYLVTVHLAQIDSEAVEKRFDLFLEGRRVLTDVAAPIRARYRTAHRERVEVAVTDGVLDLVLEHADGNDNFWYRPHIAALEIEPRDSAGDLRDGAEPTAPDK